MQWLMLNFDCRAVLLLPISPEHSIQKCQHGDALLYENPVFEEEFLSDNDDHHKSTPSLWSTWEDEQDGEIQKDVVHSVFMKLKSS